MSNFFTNNLTLADLDNPSTKNSQKTNSAFSTAPKKPSKDHLQQTRDQSYAGTKIQRNINFSSPMNRYKQILGQIKEQGSIKAVFQETEYKVLNLDEIGRNNNLQKQNRSYLFNSQGKQMKSKSFNNTLFSHDKLQWENGAKIRTGEIVRKLYGDSTKDLNFEYRKKKFFEAFKP